MKDKDTDLLAEAYSLVKWPPRPIDINNVDINSLQVGNVIRSQYPRFEDAIFASGNFKDGTPLTEDELEQLKGEQNDLFYDMLMDEFTSESPYGV